MRIPALPALALLALSLASASPLAVAQNDDEPRADAVDAETKQRAVKVLVEAAMGEDPALRSNAIEALAVLPERARPAVSRGLEDPNPGVRFAAVVTAARLGFDSLIPAIAPLVKDENPSVRAAAIYALHDLGAGVNPTPLATMLQRDDPQLRANVALLLGLIGSESAIPMLRTVAEDPMPKVSSPRNAVVRIQITEAMARLGDEQSLHALRAGVYSQFAEVRVLAINALGAVGDRRMIPALGNVLSNPGMTPPPNADRELRQAAERAQMELRLAAAGSLARLGEEAGLSAALNGADHDSPVIRSQAAWALGWFTEQQSLSKLRSLLATDQPPPVRVSAAASVLRRATDGSHAAPSAVTIDPQTAGAVDNSGPSR